MGKPNSQLRSASHKMVKAECSEFKIGKTESVLGFFCNLELYHPDKNYENSLLNMVSQEAKFISLKSKTLDL